MVLTGSMMVVELVGGIIVNSLALVSDAGHMFTHCFALSLSFFAILIAARPAPNKHTFGFYRIEILAAFTNGLMLLGVTVYILYEMVVRFLNPEPIAAIQMLVIAILGLVVNLASVLLLTGVGKDDLNVKSAFLHMIGDTLSSVAVVAGAVVIHFTGWWQVDPVLSGLIAVMIGIWAFRLLRDSANILLESTPKHLSISQVEEELRAEFPEIENLHDVHVWEITSGMYAMTAHVTVGSHTTVNRVRGVRVRMEAFVREIQNPFYQPVKSSGSLTPRFSSRTRTPAAEESSPTGRVAPPPPHIIKLSKRLLASSAVQCLHPRQPVRLHLVDVLAEELLY